MIKTRNPETVTSGIPWNVMIGLSQRLKEDGKHKDYLLILLGCHFGLRIGDLLKIKWEDILNADLLTIKERKTGKNRQITIHPRIHEALSWAQEFRKPNQELVFSNRWGNRTSVSYINKRLKFIFFNYQVQVQKASSHTLRKTFGKRVYESDGKSERALIYLSEIFGHSSTAITRRYIGITREQIADVYMKL